jgi:hypothetical protein
MGILHKQQTIHYFVALSFLYNPALQLQTGEILAQPQVPNKAVLHFMVRATGQYRRGNFLSRS